MRTGCGGTTTTTTVFGQCFPHTTPDAMPELDVAWQCEPGVYCSNQNEATQFGAMSLDRCMALCRKTTGCDYVQYDCNSDCWLLQSCSGYTQSTCGSSVYVRGANSYSYLPIISKGPYRTDIYANQALYVVYSDLCGEDDCEVTAFCPAGVSEFGETTLFKCQTIPPNSGDGIIASRASCTAKGSGDSPIMAEAICVDSAAMTTEIATSGFGEGTLVASCPPDYHALSCNCQTSWRVSLTCSGYASFPPTVGDLFTPTAEACTLYSTPEAVSHRRRSVGSVQAQVSAVCMKGGAGGNLPAVTLSYRGALLDAGPLPDSAGKETQYCGWARNADASQESGCNDWLLDPTDDGGCRPSECPTLADCVRICNACGFCQEHLCPARCNGIDGRGPTPVLFPWRLHPSGSPV